MQAARGTPLTSGADAPTEESRRLRGPRLVFAAVALVAYAADVGTKVLAVDRLTDRAPVPLVGDLLQLDLVRNPGAAFSTGVGFTVVFTALAIAAVVAILWFSRRLGSRWWALGLGLLLGGVGGNLTDRMLREPGPFRGHVVDFLRLPHWPVFNVADMCIDVGAALIVLLTLRGIHLDGRRATKADS